VKLDASFNPANITRRLVGSTLTFPVVSEACWRESAGAANRWKPPLHARAAGSICRTVLQSLDKAHGLDDEAVRTMRRWRLKPALLDREPVPVRISVDMKFALR
jgi:hypothetical protein